MHFSHYFFISTQNGAYQFSEHVTNISSLTSFTEASSGLVYYRGHCQFSFPLPSGAGNVTYSVLVTPGPSSKNLNQTVVIGE